MYHSKGRKILAWLLIVAMQSPALAADAPPPPGEVYPYWTATSRALVHRAAGDYESRSYYRFFHVADTDIPLASVTYMKQPVRKDLPASVYDPEKVAEQARLGFGFPAWTSVSKFHGAYIYTANWEKVNKIVRIVIRKNRDQFSYSMAMIRDGYSDAAVSESEILQKKLAGVYKGVPSWLDRLICWLEPLWLPSAEAADPTPPPPQPSSPPRRPDPLLPIPSQYNDNTGDIEAGFDGPGLWDRAKSAGAGLADDYSDRLARNRMVDNTANSLIPTFAGVMGSFFGNVAIEGLAVIAKLAIDAIIKAMPLSDRDLFDTFQTARKEYEKTYARVAQLEREVPIALNLIKSIKEAGGRDALMLKYASLLADTRAAISADERKMEQLPDSAEGLSARCSMARTVAKLKVVSDLVSAYNDILKRDSSLPESDAIARMCRSFLDRVSELIDAEASLQTIRPKLIAAQRGYAAALYQRYQTARGAAMQIAKDRLRDEPREKADIQRTSCQQPMEPIFADKRTGPIIEACVARGKKEHPVKSYFPFYGFFYVKYSLRPHCRGKLGDSDNPLPPDLAEKKAAIDKQCSEALAKSKAYYDDLGNLAKDGGLAPKVQVLNASVNEFRDWILRLGADQHKADEEKSIDTLNDELGQAKKAGCQLPDDKALLALKQASN